MNKLESVLCKRCGRRLRTKSSIELGMGSTCFKKYQEENNHKKLFGKDDEKHEKEDKQTTETAKSNDCTD